MTGLLENIHLALPEIIILLTACVTLMTDLFTNQRYPSVVLSVACSGLVLAAIVNFLFLGQFSTTLFHGLFISDDIGQLMKLVIYLCVFLSFIYSKNYITERRIPVGDYYVLGLFSTLGMMVLVSAHSLLTLYLGLELLSLPVYAMTAIRRTSRDGSEAAMKYFVMGGIASGMLLYGLSLLYGATGNLDLNAIANAISLQWTQPGGMIVFGLVFIVAGVGFKLAAAPFHMWVPDVYAGAPSSVTLFISTAPKIAALAMMLRLFMIALPAVSAQWQQLILVMALLSTGIGNLLAVVQDNIKRLFAYSAISHMGYALFGILAANTAGYAASLYYVLVYAIMSAAAFGLIVLMSRSGVEVEQVDDLKGLSKRNPWLALMVMILMFSMAGVPPTVGFFIKLLVLKALVDVHLTWVAALGLIFAVVGAFYYLRIIKIMYFDEAIDKQPIEMTRTSTTIFSANCLFLLYFGIFPGALISACINAFAT